MAPAYKLSYFDVTGLGEPIRFLLSYGGIEFEDNRIQKEDWPALKSGTPFGQMPILEHDGKVMHQSISICRYLAKQMKLAGKDDLENLDIDATVDTFRDIVTKTAFYHYEQNEKIKKEMGDSLFNETLPLYLEKLEAQVKKNNGYFVGGRLTWADVLYASSQDYLNFLAGKDIIADYPNLQALKENVFNIPNIKKWVEKRPNNGP